MELMVDIDLTPLRQMYYRIDLLLPLEKAVIINFRLKQTLEENTFKKVMQIALNNKFSTSGIIYKYNSLSIFYSPRKFIHAYKTFYDMLVTFISRKINPYYDDIKFKEVVEDGEKLVVKFTVTYATEYYPF